MARKSTSRHRPGRRNWLRSVRTMVYLLVGLSLFQYLVQGEVSWVFGALRTVQTTVREYAGRPQASWKRAADTLDKIGAANDGFPAPDFDLVGRVVRVADGDTISVLDGGNKQHTIRFQGIDTPERDQPFGRAAKNVLSDLIAGKTVGVVAVTTDRFGRTVGTVYRNHTNINREMVLSGYAWWYRRYAPYDRQLADAEKAARAQRLGLWADAHPIAPWDWRRGQR